VNSGNQLRKDIALVVQAELADIGIDCQVRELDWSIFLQRADTQDFDALVLGWTGNVRFPPDAYQIWHSSQAEGQGSNFITFVNDEVDSILEEYRREFDPDRRIALYQRFQEVLHEQQPYTFLWKQRLATSYARRFRGVNWYPGADRGSIGEITMEWWVTTPERAYQ
jgi:peptide/nickel transport system substrate-binding protein